MVQVRALVLIALAGCGRVGFDPASDASSGPVTCGDGVCSGTAGELCSVCADDCARTDDVCGNGECSADETTTCYADCGPQPWPWRDGSDMLVAINQARATAKTCPGGGGGTALPALVYDTAMEPAAREWAWESAHGNWMSPDACNGRVGIDRVRAVGGSSGWKAFNAANGANGAAMLIAYGPACREIMNASRTAFAGAGAHDILDAHAMMLR
jgi:hypothetical protein